MGFRLTIRSDTYSQSPVYLHIDSFPLWCSYLNLSVGFDRQTLSTVTSPLDLGDTSSHQHTEILPSNITFTVYPPHPTFKTRPFPTAIMYPREHRKKRLYLGDPPQPGITEVRRKITTLIPAPPPPPPPVIIKPATPPPVILQPPGPLPAPVIVQPLPPPPPKPAPELDVIDVIAVDVDPSEKSTKSSRKSRKSKSRSRASRSRSRDREEVIIERDRERLIPYPYPVPVRVPVPVPVPVVQRVEPETYRYVEGLPARERRVVRRAASPSPPPPVERERERINVRVSEDRWYD